MAWISDFCAIQVSNWLSYYVNTSVGHQLWRYLWHDNGSTPSDATSVCTKRITDMSWSPLTNLCKHLFYVTWTEVDIIPQLFHRYLRKRRAPPAARFLFERGEIRMCKNSDEPCQFAVELDKQGVVVALGLVESFLARMTSVASTLRPAVLPNVLSYFQLTAQVRYLPIFVALPLLQSVVVCK